MSEGWQERAISLMVQVLAEDYGFPEANALKLARVFVDLSEPEFGEE